ncbi:MAG: hypothetical protein AB7I45_16865 [Planctomycetota bacterium]
MSAYASPDSRRLRALGIDPGYFTGVWSRRHPWSAPGAIYSTTFNTLSFGAQGADQSGLILFDDRGEFLWRQPLTAQDLDSVLTAANNDDAMSYQVDGDRRWTPVAVAAWRRSELPALLQWASDPDTATDLAASSSGWLTSDQSRAALRNLTHYWSSRGIEDLAAYSSWLALRH